MRTATTCNLRERAVAHYHDLLAQDSTLLPLVFEKLLEAMRSERLVYRDRPIGIALRPHLLERKQFNILTHRAELIASALEKIAVAAVGCPALMDELGLTEMEQELALIDPGFSGVGVTTRMDGFVQGETIKFVEYNAENPSSLSDQAGLNRLLFELPEMAIFAEHYQLQEFSPAEKLLEALLATYHEWGGSNLPNVAILDWKNLPTATEFVLLQNYFEERGVRTIVCSPDELEYSNHRLRCGEFEVDLVYKRILIHEFLARYDENHPLTNAYLHHDVCLVNPFGCKIMHKKASFEMLTDPAYQSWWTPAEHRAIGQSIPWTRRLLDRRTTCNGRTVDLLEFVRRGREHLVLKPNDDYGGRGVFLGPLLGQTEWEAAISTALTGDFVVQEAVELHLEQFPIFNEMDWELRPMFVDTNPFLFRGKVCGAMVRLSSSPVVNVSSGGGETGFFVIEETVAAQEMVSESQ